jgi:hypothetical protein
MVVYQLVDERPRRITSRERAILEGWRDEPLAFRRRRAG